MKNNIRGFTLIELMIVIAIVGILSSIAIISYQNYIIRAQISEGLILMDGLKQGVIEYYSNSAQCPNNIQTNEFGIAKATDISGNYVSKIEVMGQAPNCEIKVTFNKNKVNDIIKNKSLKLIMSKKDGSYEWRCYSDDINHYFLPKTCY